MTATGPTAATTPRQLRPTALGTPGTGRPGHRGRLGHRPGHALALAEVGRPVAIWDVDAAGAEETAAAVPRRSGWWPTAAVVDVADSAAVAGGRAPRPSGTRARSAGSSTPPGCPGPRPSTTSTTRSGTPPSTSTCGPPPIIGRHCSPPFREAGPGLGGGAHLVHRGAVRELRPDRLLRVEGRASSASCARSPSATPWRGSGSTPSARARWPRPCSRRPSSCPGFREQIEERTPLRRVAAPDEIARPDPVPAVRRGLLHHRGPPDGRRRDDRGHRHLTASLTRER